MLFSTINDNDIATTILHVDTFTNDFLSHVFWNLIVGNLDYLEKDYSSVFGTSELVNWGPNLHSVDIFIINHVLVSRFIIIIQ